MQGLEPGATYFVRSYLTTPTGTVYGNEVAFTTLEGDKAATEGALCARFSVAPDRWKSADYSFKVSNVNPADSSSNIIFADDWTKVLEPAGAVFLPNAGMRLIDGVHSNRGGYYTASAAVSDAWHFSLYHDGYTFSAEGHRGDGLSVRLVRDVE